jgi:hypothetical protein
VLCLVGLTINSDMKNRLKHIPNFVAAALFFAGGCMVTMFHSADSGFLHTDVGNVTVYITVFHESQISPDGKYISEDIICDDLGTDSDCSTATVAACQVAQVGAYLILAFALCSIVLTTFNIARINDNPNPFMITAAIVTNVGSVVFLSVILAFFSETDRDEGDCSASGEMFFDPNFYGLVVLFAAGLLSWIIEVVDCFWGINCSGSAASAKSSMGEFLLLK